jgi:UDP-N-acetylenolpyruvoylglucosamine reductase
MTKGLMGIHNFYLLPGSIGDIQWMEFGMARRREVQTQFGMARRREVHTQFGMARRREVQTQFGMARRREVQTQFTPEDLTEKLV